MYNVANSILGVNCGVDGSLIKKRDYSILVSKMDYSPEFELLGK
jgi:hypothetical protein